MSVKKLFRSWKIWVLIACIIMALVAIWPNPWADGVAVRSVIKDSSASIAGFSNPKATATPMSREVIHYINNVPIKNIDDYTSATANLRINTTIVVKTNKDIYKIVVKPKIETILLNDTEEATYIESVLDNATGKYSNVTKTKTVFKTLQKIVGVEDIGLRVYNAPKSNIKMGLDLQGGSRVILKPETDLSKEDLDILVENMKQRLNVYGLSDISVRPTVDLDGKEFIIVEIAGATDEEVKDLLAKQGKFEGKIGNDSVFKGGADIKHVCKTADCSRIQECNPVSEGQYYCRFMFAITLSPEAAQRQADRTANLEVKVENGEGFLTEPLDLYLDDEKVDSLRIGESLKGRAETEISISGSGTGVTQQDALNDASVNMKRLQTILVTGSLPVKLSIEDSSTVSPTLGSEFIQNTMFVGLIAMILVIVTIMIRYKRLVVSIPVAITLASEVIILLGFAAIIGWNIDLIAIAAIIIAIGTGIDSQVVIIDEMSGKNQNTTSTNWKDKIKNAFFIIMASYFTMVVAMIPLLSAGAGLLKGFAITTILGVSIGVFITRPAFAVIAETLLRKEEIN
jgi:preprotein translocase subunit SecD